MERGRVGDFGLSVRAWPPSALLDPPFPGAVRTLLVTSGWCLTPARHPQGVRLTLAMLPPSALAAGTERGSLACGESPQKNGRWKQYKTKCNNGPVKIPGGICQLRISYVTTFLPKMHDYTRGWQTTARGLNPACCLLLYSTQTKDACHSHF